MSNQTYNAEDLNDELEGSALSSSRLQKEGGKKEAYDAEKDEDVEEVSILLQEQIKLNNINESMRLKNLALLRKSVETYGAVESESENATRVNTAKKLLSDIDDFLTELNTACDNKNRKQILDSLAKLSKLSFRKYLLKEERDAQDLAEELKRNNHKLPILVMDRKTMAEVSSYAKPKEIVHDVMKGALLLLGEDEGTTADWKKCQSFCHPDGRNGMNRRMMKFDASKLDPFIVKRARMLLRDILLTEVKKASPGAATFFVWAIGVLKEFSANDDEEEADDSSKSDVGKMGLANIIKKEKDIFMKQREKERRGDLGETQRDAIDEELNLSPTRRTQRQPKPYYNAIYNS